MSATSDRDRGRRHLLIAWILDAIGVLGSVMSSPEARAAVVATIIVLELATVIGVAALVREKRAV